MAARKASRLPGLAEAFYDPLGSFNDGSFGAPIGGHSDHVHVSDVDPQGMLQALALAKQMGLTSRENPYVDKVDPVHVRGSYHYRTFPGLYNGRQLGEAVDVSGAPDLMAAYYRAVTSGGAQAAAPQMQQQQAVPQALAQSQPQPATQQQMPQQPMPQQGPDPRAAFAQALLGGISPTGQLDQNGLLQALLQRKQAMR